VNVTLVPAQIVVPEPDAMLTLAGRFGFTVKLAVIWQPLLFVYVIVVVPAATAVTRPVALTVATPVLDETHGLLAAAVADPVNCDVPPIHAFSVPVIVGSAFTVVVIAFDVAGEPVRHGLALEVITTVTICPFVNAFVVKVALLVPAFVPFTFHW